MGSYDFVGNSTGGWVDGRWVALGWDSSRFGNPTAAGAPPAGGVAQGKAAATSSGAGGSADGAGEQVPVEPSDEHIRVGYAVTGVLDVDPIPIPGIRAITTMIRRVRAIWMIRASWAVSLRKPVIMRPSSRWQSPPLPPLSRR